MIPPKWTRELDDRLRELGKLGGPPFADIARILSAESGKHFTSNACIGRSHRLGMPLRGRPRGRFGAALQGVTPVKAAAPTKLKTSPRWRKRKRGAKGPVFFERLQPHHCRYPVTDTPPHLFCAKQRRDGSPYCEEHHALAHYPQRKQA